MHRLWIWLTVCVALGGALILPSALSAAPASQQPRVETGHQVPEWMSLESASRLTIGIDVYAPSYVPAPFGGEPEIQAYDGYYSFYWLIPGSPPTFLQITGEAGGAIPAFSYYDRNIQLQQNASVMGYPAYHDVSPIYDKVYWQIGDVVYTVDSFNLTSDDTLSLANSLMAVVPPEPEEPTGGEEPAQEQEFTLGVPASVQSGETAGIGVFGEGDVLLSAEDGYFPASGENNVVVAGGTTIDWVAPEYESDATISFYLYELESGAELTSASTALEGYLSTGESVVADVQCPVEVSAGKQARVTVTGNGSIVIGSTDGSWPAESPNIEFQSDADGGAILVGTLPDQATASLSWLAPQTPGPVFVTVTDLDDTWLDECSMEVVTTSVSGNLAPAATGGNTPGDGTGIVDVDPAIVLRAIANPSGFAGDASGGPEANAPDYGLPQESSAQTVTSDDGAEGDSSAVTLDESIPSDAALGPSSGAAGMVAISMNSLGGMLENREGATIIVPEYALTEPTTVMIQPVPDHELPDISGVTLVSGTAFDVMFSGADGKAAGSLAVPASLTIALKSGGTGQGAQIYQIDNGDARPMTTSDEGQGSVTTEVTELSRYVIGIPAPAVVGSTRTFNPFIVGGLALIALLSAGLLISRGFSRRKTRVIPVRRPVPSRVRYR